MSVESGPADADERDGVAVASGWRANAVAGPGVQSVRYKDREYLRFSITPLVGDFVYQYPERGTSELLPVDSLAETVNMWEGTPLTYVHPDNRKQTVRDPDAYAENVVGAVHNPEMVDGKLRVDGILDVKKAEDVGGHAAALVDDLRAGKTVQVSAGYGTVDDEARSGRIEGEPYDGIQGTVYPDHVAVFPDSDDSPVARCRPEDGCAAPARANGTENEYTNESTPMSETKADTNDAEPDEEEIAELRRELTEIQAMLADIVSGESGETPAQPQTNAGACECERGQVQANYGAVAGAFERDLDEGRNMNRENAEAYPAGGRSNWEKRKCGIADVPGDDDELPPAGGRSNWEARRERARTNAAQSAADTQASPAARRSMNARQDGVEPSEWATAEYPLQAKRKAEEERAKRERWNRLREQARRTDRNTTKRRHTDQ